MDQIWEQLITRLEIAWGTIRDGEEIVLLIGRVHFAQLQQHITRIAAPLADLDRTRCELREIPYPIVAVLPSCVDGFRS